MSFLLPAIGALGILLIYDGLTTTAGSVRGPVRARLDRLAAESGIPGFTGRHLLLASAAAALVALVTVAGLTGSLPVAAAFSVAGGWSPLALARSRRRLRRERFRAAWPDALATTISAVRAGISLPDACAHLAGKGPEVLRPGFASFASSYQSAGSFQLALERAQLEFSDPVADRVLTAVALAHDVGGSDLVRVLRALADFVREDLRTRREIEARWSWTVTAARVASASPWVVLLMMAMRPESQAAYGSTAGLLVIVIGAAATLLGYRLMLRAARLPDERRLV